MASFRATILQLLLDSIAQALERKHLYGYPARHWRKVCISHTLNLPDSACPHSRAGIPL
jgi:hypothetical protein